MMKKTWVYRPKPAQLDRFTKDMLKEKVQKFVDSSKRLSQKINRIEIKAGRIYIYWVTTYEEIIQSRNQRYRIFGIEKMRIERYGGESWHIKCL